MYEKNYLKILTVLQKMNSVYPTHSNYSMFGRQHACD